MIEEEGGFELDTYQVLFTNEDAAADYCDSDRHFGIYWRQTADG